ncbi:uncharacterized protein LOC109722900 [Ananas comosus]|uniref:Uncharacterized protein LOC109722900 n=1 Tax=Ananas comosus TaxID=4615 RepID=A0A6P5GDH3_ANACO|nr:uncharacterized protein LOC109722900 [Ananas comosus]
MAASMRWHEEGRTKDGILRHPADALAWKSFDSCHPDFASDPRSIRLGLASDGFNPFRTMSSTYSTWPVVLIPYNLPPWLCMKQSSLILSMVIPGEKGPGNDIDVFLQPLIHELKKLWEGVDAFDAFTKQNFNMRGALIWTINDFPAYANLSGWSTKGRNACPCCLNSTDSRWLKNGGKFCYMGYRRWLEQNHPFRFQKDDFDGSIELRTAPNSPSGSDILRQLEGINHNYNFDDVDEYIIDSHNYDEEGMRAEEQLWKKKSIFFDLPYWKDNLLRHNLDVMHIEKNVSDNLIGTMLNISGRTKDNLKARLDLKDMGIRHDLHPEVMPNNKVHIPPAYYTMSAQEKVTFLTVLKNLKVPDGYASNISRRVNLKERTLSNLKSHDGHILMQDILPIALRAAMPRQVVAVISGLSSFFKSLCSKALKVEELDQLQSRIALTLCHMEKIFPPSFFTIMIHLNIHLVAEAKLGGPVHYRWMYPIERYLVRLKSYVRNRAQPEGSIAEGYIAEECLTFCSRYLEGVESVFNRPQRNFDNMENIDNYMFLSGGRVLGKIESVVLDSMSIAQAHRYVLLHCDKIASYRGEFLAAQRRANPNIRANPSIEHKWLVENFPEWLLAQVPQMAERNCSDEILAIARGPNNIAKRCNGFIINGFRFHTKNREKFRKTQNSGVMVEADGKTYYGQLTDIFEIDYYGSFKDDPFIFSSQAKQVFYVQDPKNEEWSHIIMIKPRDLYDMGARLQEEDDDETYTQCIPLNIPTADELNNCTSWARSTIDGGLIHDIGGLTNS